MARMSRRLVAAVTAIAAAALTLSACAPDVTSGPATTISASPEPSRAAAPPPPDDPRPAVAWPLTGIDATGAAEADLDRPALAVKIENSAQARPQENLHQADVVFEEYVESGISRLVAIYHSDMPDSIGPIRSMRPMDANIMGSFEGPLVFSGAQRRFINAAASSGQRLIAQDVGSGGFYRASGRSAPHNLHGRPADFLRQAADMPAPSEQWAFAYPAESSNVTAEGEPATSISVVMSGHAQPRWEWDADAGVWWRSERTTPHVSQDGVRQSAVNVVSLWVDVRYTSSQGGSAVPETIVVTDSGTGYVAAGGDYVEVEWSKAGQFEPYVITLPGGEPVEFLPGQTWVHLVPKSGVSDSTSISYS